MKILGYKYNSLEEAEKAVQDLNIFWQLPKENCISHFEISLFSNWGGGFWIYKNDYWYEPVLGIPYFFEVPDPPLTF
jgi:hypothetical protein